MREPLALNHQGACHLDRREALLLRLVLARNSRNRIPTLRQREIGRLEQKLLQRIVAAIEILRLRRTLARIIPLIHTPP